MGLKHIRHSDVGITIGETKVYLFGMVRVFHRPHPSPDTDKGAVTTIRKWLENHGVMP